MTPGAGVLYIVARSVGQGRRSGLLRAGRWIGGLIFIGLGVYTALAGPRTRPG